MSFSALDISPLLATALAASGISAPLPVQIQAAPVLLAGQSAMLVSRTGSGKTLAYLLPILSRLDPELAAVQAIILAPTHELAMQIQRVAADLIKQAGLPLRTQALIGGAASSRQIEGLKKKPHLVVGSAGRIVHLMDLGKLKLGQVAWLVFDEADRLLIEEKLEHIRRIASVGLERRAYVFVSATEAPATTRVAKDLAPDLTVVRVQEERINPAIRHMFLVCEERDKIDWARKVVRGLNPARALVFVHRGAAAEKMTARLAHHGLSVADLHGARDKFDRQKALEAFRQGKAQVLIASDIAARGLDVSGVELVINLDAPSQSRDYLHRAGRTGRADKPGLVLNLLTEAEQRLPRRYAEELGIVVEEVRLARGRLIPTEGSAPDKPQRAQPMGRKRVFRSGPATDQARTGRPQKTNPEIRATEPDAARQDAPGANSGRQKPDAGSKRPSRPGQAVRPDAPARRGKQASSPAADPDHRAGVKPKRRSGQ